MWQLGAHFHVATTRTGEDVTGEDAGPGTRDEHLGRDERVDVRRTQDRHGGGAGKGTGLETAVSCAPPVPPFCGVCRDAKEMTRVMHEVRFACFSPEVLAVYRHSWLSG